jgi:hypothetical protein
MDEMAEELNGGPEIVGPYFVVSIELEDTKCTDQ